MSQGDNDGVVFQEEALQIAGMDAMRRCVDDRGVLDVDHRVRDLALGHAPDGFAHLVRA
nr:hypothetical protein [Bradyrhizobium hipponense]